MEHVNMMINFALNVKLKALRRIPYGDGQLLRSQGAEKLAHLILKQFSDAPDLKSIRIEAKVAGRPPCAQLSMTYDAKDDVDVYLNDECINEAFPGEFFGVGNVTIFADHPLITALRGDFVWDDYWPTLSYFATVIAYSFECSEDRE